MFRYPVNPSQDFIKRVIGVGGDSRRLSRQEADASTASRGRRQADGTYSYLEGLTLSRRLERSSRRAIGAVREHTIARQPAGAAGLSVATYGRFRASENCDYNERGFSCKVPAGHYLMMGDNRDNSDDSRYWGFVPDDHIRGKAFFIWFNWDDIASFAFKRVGSGIR